MEGGGGLASDTKCYSDTVCHSGVGSVTYSVNDPLYATNKMLQTWIKWIIWCQASIFRF